MNKKSHVYIIELIKTVKIGMSVDPHERVQNVKVGIGEEIKHLHIYEVDNMAFVEKQLHDMFAFSRLEGEWFNKNAHLIPRATKLVEDVHNGTKIQ